MSHQCDDPECGRPHLTEALMARLDGSERPESLRKALGVSLCGPVSLNAVARKYEGEVTKAAGIVDEMSRIKKIEDRMFRAFLSAYVEKANAAIKVGMARFPKRGDKPVTRGQILKALQAADRSFFRGWAPKSLLKMTDEVMEEVYKLSQQAVLRKVMGAKGYKGDRSLMYKAIATIQIKPSFTLVDQAAVQALQGQQRFWVNAPGVWTKADDLIKQTALQSIEGMLPAEAGEQLEEVMQAKYGTGKSLIRSAAYWEGVAANAATTARVNGALREMSEIGVTKYEIMNPMDERTTEICSYLNGKTMSVSSAIGVLDALDAKGVTPAAVKKLHPWHPNDFRARMGKIGINTAATQNTGFPAGKDAALAKAGFSFPPYHFRCRSTVDISDEVDFASLGQTVATATAPAGVVPTPPLVATAKPKPPPKPKVPPKVTPPPTPPPPQPVAPNTPPVVKPKTAPTATPSEVRPGMFQTSDGQWMTIDEFTLNAARREGGMHTKCFFTDDIDGSTWMFKPYSHRSMGGIDQSFRATGDKVAADVARALGVPTAEVQVMQMPAGHRSLSVMNISDTKPVTGSFQRFVNGIQGEVGSTPLTALDDIAIHQVQREHLFDWMISNYDSHGANILRTQDGVVGIDKGQLFRYFGKDSLKLDFNPNRSYGVTTYYNQQFGRYARGEFGTDFTLSANNPTVQKFIKAVEDMPDEQFIRLYRPYFDEASEAGVRWNGLNGDEALQKLLERKRNIRKDVTDFYDDLEKQRRRALGLKDPPATVATGDYRPINSTFIRDLKSGDADGVAYYTRASGHIRSNEIMLNTIDEDGVVGSLSIHSRGHAKLMDRIRGSLGDADIPRAVDTTRDAQAAFLKTKQSLEHQAKTVAKSLNAHLVDESHHVFDGAIPDHTWNLMRTTWKQAEDMLASAAPGSAEQITANNLIQWFQKVTKSSSSTTIQLGQNTDSAIIAVVKSGTKNAGFIGSADTSGAKLSAIIRAKPPSVAPRATSRAKDRFKFTARPTTANRAFPDVEGYVEGGVRKLRWQGEEISNFQRMNGGTVPVGLPGTRAYEITFANTRNPIRVVYVEPHASQQSLKGAMRIYIDKPGAKINKRDIEEAMEALKSLGLDTGAAAAADMEALYIMKNVEAAYPGALKGGRYWREGMPRLTAEASPEDIIDQWGNWMARDLGHKDLAALRRHAGYDYNPSYMGGGRMGRGRWYRFDISEDQLEGVAPHICMNADGYDVIMSMLNNGSKGWGSNMYKQRTAIGMSGESPGKDVRTGGATRVFQGVFRKALPKKGASRFDRTAFPDGDGVPFRESNYYSSDYSTVRFRNRGLRDVDGIHYDHDNYGRLADFDGNHTMTRGSSPGGFSRAKDQSAAQNLLDNISNGGNEFLPKSFVGLEELDLVMVRNATQRTELIKALREAGIRPTSPPNRRWESVIQVREQ